MAAFLKEQGITVVVVNPHHVNKTKDSKAIRCRRATTRTRRSSPT
nr:MULTISPECIES: hypothetical protein [unclassified Paenibacillus]